jgi:hypothetical protein
VLFGRLENVAFEPLTTPLYTLGVDHVAVYELAYGTGVQEHWNEFGTIPNASTFVGAVGAGRPVTTGYGADRALPLALEAVTRQ